MTAYISVSFSHRTLLQNQLSVIIDTLDHFHIAPFIFVDHYRFSHNEERMMMQQAASDIDRCDLLIAETSEKGIGIGVEAGYAKAKGKPVIYLRKKTAPHSTTVSGISDFQIIYEQETDLRQQLTAVLEKIC